jgi:uncharacterized protein
MIDAHTHIFDEKSYQTYQEKARGRVEKILTLHYYAEITPEGPGNPYSLESLLELAAQKPDLAVVASVDMGAEVAPQLERCAGLFAQNKLVGLKIYPGYQPVAASSAAIIPVAQFCAQQGCPLIIHAGDFDPHEAGVLDHSHPLHVDTLAAAVPDCTIVVAHIGDPYIVETMMILNRRKNVYADLSGLIQATEPKYIDQQVAAYIGEIKKAAAFYPHARGKILFGTDYANEQSDIRLFDEYGQIVEAVFEPSERERVYKDLAKELFHL